MKSVIIQKSLLIGIQEAIERHNHMTKPKLKVDYAVYFIGLINRRLAYTRIEESPGYSVSLCSQALKRIYHKYQKYLRFLQEERFIVKTANHGSDTKTCKKYRIKYDYLLDYVQSYSFTDKLLLKNFNEQGENALESEKMEFVQKSRPHLVVGFNSRLNFASEEAYEEVSRLLTGDLRKYLQCSQFILEWSTKAWSYSIKPETDNRLHSTLTRTNRILRKYISYNGEPLASLDIKTSQPYFLCSILKGIVQKDVALLDRIGATSVFDSDLIKDLFQLNLDVDNLRKFARAVLFEDFYECLIPHIPIKYHKGEPYRWVSKGGKRRRKVFASERDLAKEAVLSFFNGSLKTRQPEIVAIRKFYPAITELFKFLKNRGVEVHRLLHFVEAYTLLDKVAREVHERNNHIPLFSIHDCLVTTERNLNRLQKEARECLFQLTGIKPKLELEYWNINPKS